MIVDALERAGHDVAYCSMSTVHRHRVILVSITAACDWWSFIAERQKWQPGDYTVVVGGAGMLNIRPFLDFADVFVWGRAEEFITPLVDALIRGDTFEHESVAFSRSFSPDGDYRIAQAPQLYPHDVKLENGKTWRERAIGCRHRCKFCAYTWHRKHLGGNQSESGAADAIWNVGDTEVTLLDLNLDEPQGWPPIGTIGLDGMSERLRFAAGKKISREDLRAFFAGLVLSEHPPQKLKIYTVVGYPDETRDDWKEFLEDLSMVDMELKKEGKQWGVILQCTPFRAMPATPAACWPMSQLNYRGEIARKLKSPPHIGHVFYQGNRYWATESTANEHLSTVALDAIALRGTEADSENIAKVARTRRFWRARSEAKLATLAKHFDLDRLFGEFQWSDLPTRYLHTYAKVEMPGLATPALREAVN